MVVSYLASGELFMITISQQTRKLNAWNWWLWRVLGRRTLILDMLLRNGFTQEQVNVLKVQHFDAFIQTLLDYIATVEVGHDSVRRHEVMLRHYGLVTGQRNTLQAIGNDYQLSRERIRQLVQKRMDQFKTDKQRAELEAKILSVAHQLLD
jgi:hypothetical protein